MILTPGVITERLSIEEAALSASDLQVRYERHAQSRKQRSKDAMVVLAIGEAITDKSEQLRVPLSQAISSSLMRLYTEYPSANHPWQPRALRLARDPNLVTTNEIDILFSEGLNAETGEAAVYLPPRDDAALRLGALSHWHLARVSDLTTYNPESLDYIQNNVLRPLGQAYMLNRQLLNEIKA